MSKRKITEDAIQAPGGKKVKKVKQLEDNKRYNVGYGDDLVQLHSYEIPEFQIQHFTLDELIAATADVDITHMCIRGDIPPHMDTIAPNLKWVMVEDMSRPEQLQRINPTLSSLSTMVIRGNESLTAITASIGQLTNLTSLDISRNYSLTTLPESIGQLTNLTSLDISRNSSLTTLPESIGQLTNLTSLDIRNNDSLTTIPEMIGQLTNLTSLNISRSSSLTTIPESIGQLAHLTSLKISDNSSLTTIPEMIGQLTNLTSLDINRNSSLTTIPEGIGQLAHLTSLNISRNPSLTTIPESIGQLTYLTSLDISNNDSLTTMPESKGQLTNLTSLDISSNSSLTTVPESIGQLTNLTSLDISYNSSLTTIPESIGQLTYLTSLDISSNDSLSTIPESIGQLNNLTSLDISLNSSLTTIPETIGQLTNLNSLTVSHNSSLTTIPASIGQLTHLTSLDISHNSSLTPIPESICQLTNLTSLKITSNKSLSTIPESIGQLTNLTSLNISNNSSLTTLPASIGRLTHLTSLKIASNKSLSTIPESIGQLTYLVSLDIGGNKSLSIIPESICQLTNLTSLEISGNISLYTISENVFNISSLQKVACFGCDSLVSPPQTVCRQGLDAVRKYFYDLHIERGRNQRLIPVTVIGNSNAGKTSLVLSAQQNKRVLTERSSAEGKLDEATKVFKVCEAKVSDTSKLVFSDLGGHKLYHYSYQLSFKSQCVPLLVIDIADFDRLAAQNGEEAACVELCMNWLSQLYISCPRLGRPVVVLTHCDKVTDECCNRRKQQLVDMTERLRMSIINEENKVARTTSPLFTMMSFADTAEPLLRVKNIILSSKTSSPSVIYKLKQVLDAAGSKLITEIPASWYRILNRITSDHNKPFFTLAEIDELFPDDTDHVTLQYLHDTGRIMWFKNIDSLSIFIFHRPEVLTALIETLYNHTQDVAWQKRLAEFTPYLWNGKSVEQSKYKKMVNQFQSTGVMEAALLHNILEQESELTPDTGIELLRTFNLIHKFADKCIIPYFAARQISVPKVYTHLIPLKADLFLRGLPVPNYVYSLITAAFLDINVNQTNHAEAGKNGAIISGDGMFKYLVHDASAKCVSLTVLTPAKQICQAWKEQIDTLRKLISDLKSVWKGVRYETMFYCAHCLLINTLDPTNDVDPAWLDQPALLESDQSYGISRYSGKETCFCQHETSSTENQSFPRPFMHPCFTSSDQGYDSIKNYVSNLTAFSDKSQILKLLMEKYPLDVYDMTLLCDHSDQYIIPYVQTKVKRCGLVLFNKDNRENALEEAYNMEDSLTTAGIETNKIECSRAIDLFDTMKSQIKEMLAGGLSLLVISIMSHGIAGIITGSDGTQAIISDIVSELQNNLPEHIPLIIIIQACQGDHGATGSASTSSSLTDAQGSTANDHKHIILKRPHTLLLMSTVHGGSAVRGAFSGAIARQIAKTDGKITIEEMVTNANIDLKKKEPDHYNQTPELRSTLQKSLVLPPGGLVPDSQQSQNKPSKISLLRKLGVL